jgi:hypothetical protein
MASVLILPGCKKDPEPLFTNSVIAGYSETWDLLTYGGKITVIASGPYGKKGVETDETGQFFISGLGNGTYKLQYTKDGYGTINQYDIQLFGNDTASAGRVTLFKKYDTFQLPVFSGITKEIHPGNYNENVLFVVIVSDMKTLDPVIPVVFFMDTQKKVDYKNYAFASSNYSVGRSSQSSEYFNFYINPGVLPFNTGDEVFVIAYIANPNEVSNGYFDKYLGIEQLSTLIPDKHSQVMSFIMP